MTSRFRLVLTVAGVLVLAGCGDGFNAGPIQYSENDRLGTELKGKPKLQAAVRKALVDLFGENPQRIKAPKGAGFLDGGRWLAGSSEEGTGGQTRVAPHLVRKYDPVTLTTALNADGKPYFVRAGGGYTLYRHHCLHCHGVSGDGQGPTASFLYPRPRDYRPGLFKFTSTTNGSKPTREDLRKTIRFGLHGTSMPAFESLMSPEEIEQVIEYVKFLSIRGETELSLIDEAATAGDENDPNPLPADRVQEVAETVYNKWNQAEGAVVNPPVKRSSSDDESIARGRDLFLGRTKEKLVCTTCHGTLALGNGDQWIDEEFTNEVAFYGKNPEELMKERVYHGLNPTSLDKKAAEEKEKELKSLQDLWAKSLDSWKQPLRPANLNRGVYKGGRRPIDIYWRIADGITGTPMPGHSNAVKPEQIWDIVNFVLALPYEPKLLTEAPPAPTAQPTVAQRTETEGARLPRP